MRTAENAGTILLWSAIIAGISGFICASVCHSYGILQIMNAVHNDSMLRKWSIASEITAIVSACVIVIGFIIRQPGIGFTHGLLYSVVFTSMYWIHLPCLMILYRTLAQRMKKVVSISWSPLLICYALAAFFNAVQFERHGQLLSLLSLFIFAVVLAVWTISIALLRRLIVVLPDDAGCPECGWNRPSSSAAPRSPHAGT